MGRMMQLSCPKRTGGAGPRMILEQRWSMERNMCTSLGIFLNKEGGGVVTGKQKETWCCIFKLIEKTPVWGFFELLRWLALVK